MVSRNHYENALLNGKTIIRRATSPIIRRWSPNWAGIVLVVMLLVLLVATVLGRTNISQLTLENDFPPVLQHPPRIHLPFYRICSLFLDATLW